MSRLKLLHLVQSAGYGVTIYVESLIASLKSEIFEQYLVGSDYYNNKRFEGIVDRLITMPMDRNISWNDMKSVMECRRIIKALAPDVIYCHSAKAGIYGRLACLGTGVKVVYNPHGWAFNMKCPTVKKLFYSCVEAIFALMTDKIVSISDYEKKSVPWYLPSSKIEVIKNGIDVENSKLILSESTLLRNLEGIPVDAFVIGIIARISVQKGQDMLVNIAEKVREKIPNAFFVIVGGKSDDVNIESLLEIKHLSDCFLITGEVNNAIRYASLFDVAVLTSRWEGFGLVLLEYMVAKKPIVAFGVDAIPEIIIDNYNGLLVEPEDLDSFAKFIIKLHDDECLRNNLISNGVVRVNHFFDLSRVAAEHEKLLIDLCK